MTTNAERQEKINELRRKLREDIAELERNCQRQIAAIEREIKEHAALELKEARARVQAVIAQSGFSAAEVFAAFDPAAKQTRKSPRPPEKKYLGPEGQVWTGRGPKPKWFKAAQAAGQQVKVIDVNAS